MALDKATEATRKNEGLRLNVAVNYSGRSEIVDACRQVVTEWAAGEPVEIDEETIGQYLCTAGYPDPDLLIRTSGEMRISNFLLWQLAYSELWFTETLWPDFRRQELFQAVLDYQQRERRYGGRPEASRPSESRLERGS
jgi:undecaprenyl diphosphate synthase